MFRQLAFFLLSSLFFAMAGDSDPNDILFTLLGGMHSKGKESPLQNINNIRDTFAEGIGISRKSLDSILVLFTLLAGIPSKGKELPLQNINGYFPSEKEEPRRGDGSGEINTPSKCPNGIPSGSPCGSPSGTDSPSETDRTSGTISPSIGVGVGVKIKVKEDAQVNVGVQVIMNESERESRSKHKVK